MKLLAFRGTNRGQASGMGRASVGNRRSHSGGLFDDPAKPRQLPNATPPSSFSGLPTELTNRRRPKPPGQYTSVIPGSELPSTRPTIPGTQPDPDRQPEELRLFGPGQRVQGKLMCKRSTSALCPSGPLKPRSRRCSLSAFVVTALRLALVKPFSQANPAITWRYRVQMERSRTCSSCSTATRTMRS